MAEHGQHTPCRDRLLRLITRRSQVQILPRLAIEALGRLGLSMRDTAALLGLSHQRIAQIAKRSNIPLGKAGAELGLS